MAKDGKTSYAPIKSPKETESKDGYQRPTGSTLPAGAVRPGGK